MTSKPLGTVYEVSLNRSTQVLVRQSRYFLVCRRSKRIPVIRPFFGSVKSAFTVKDKSLAHKAFISASSFVTTQLTIVFSMGHGLSCV